VIAQFVIVYFTPIKKMLPGCRYVLFWLSKSFASNNSIWATMEFDYSYFSIGLSFGCYFYPEFITVFGTFRYRIRIIETKDRIFIDAVE